MLCECHLAVKYDGGTKISPNDWIEYYNSSTTRPDKYLREYTKLSVNKQGKMNEKSSIRKITSYMRNTLSNCLFRKEADSSSA